MSREAVVEFLDRVRTDAALRTALGASPTGEAYVEQGRRLGHEFTLAELRSVTNAHRFYARAAADSALSARLSSARDEASVVALAAEVGLACQLGDLQAVLLPQMGAELSDALLENVAGGAGWSFPNVTKVPSSSGGVPIPYPNFG